MTDALNPDDHVVPAPRADQAAFVLAQAVRETMKFWAGDDPAARLALLSVFLFYLTTDVNEPQKVAELLRIVANEVASEHERGLSDKQIKYMVDRFLSWRLPKNFNPDGGISFQAAFNDGTAFPSAHEPSGTNLLDAVQADAMVRHMLDGMPT